jgi:predicted transcriptional regulator
MLENNESMSMIPFVAEIVAAYVSNHELGREELPDFIQLVHRSLCNLSSGQSFKLNSPSAPAVPIEDSITPNHIICLEDGIKLKMLKRHLKTSYNMTPDQYRERWGLPNNYPMVAPNYTKQRQSIAKSIGLGTHKKSQKKTAA